MHENAGFGRLWWRFGSAFFRVINIMLKIDLFMGLWDKQ